MPASLIAPIGKNVGDLPDATQPAGPQNVPYAYPSVVTNRADAIALTGSVQNNVYGPGYYQINMSMFKNFTTWREQYLQFRADAFNVLNHPTLGNPTPPGQNGSMNANGGLISGPKTFQNNTPDARFFQLALKYAF